MEKVLPTCSKPQGFRCITCGIVKPIEGYGKNDDYKDNRITKCKSCVSYYNNRYVINPDTRARRKELYKAKAKIRYAEKHAGVEKTCTLCKKTLPLSEYHKNACNTYGVKSRCKACCKEIGKKYLYKRGLFVKRKPVFSEWYYRSRKCIAQNALTNSKRPESFVLGSYPTHVKSGSGAVLTDARGVKYYDYICGLGTNLFGYGNSRIGKSIGLEYNLGTLFSLGSTLEVEAAERLKGIFPFVDEVKFLKTGTEACMAAIKIARAYTGKSKILVEGYHGWSDPFIDTLPASGVDRNATADTFRGIIKHIEPLELGAFAAVIVEPIETDCSSTRIQWLNKLREICTRTKTLLIFDEVITGFRFPKKSVSNHYGITPDIICLGKAMGGGFPLSAVGGKKKIMSSKEYFVSSTFAGDTIALRAFIECCDMLNGNKYNIEKLWDSGAQFLKKFNDICPDKLRIDGYPTRGKFVGNVEFKHLFWQECSKGGILFGPSWFYNFPLMEHSDQTINICKDVARNILAGRVKLEGDPPVSPFATKQRM